MSHSFAMLQPAMNPLNSYSLFSHVMCIIFCCILFTCVNILRKLCVRLSKFYKADKDIAIPIKVPFVVGLMSVLNVVCFSHHWTLGKIAGALMPSMCR